MEPVILIQGFPGRADRGFLGWSSIILIRGEENYLFDTGGYGERAVLLERLRCLGIMPSDIQGIFLSHFHFDHALNYRFFPNAEIYLHSIEYEYAKANNYHDVAVPDEFLEPLEKSGRLRLVRKEQEILPGLTILEVPGHTPGCMAVKLVHKGKRYVLAGDAVKNLAELVSGQVAMSLDAEASEKSISKIRAEADFVIPGHDSLLIVDGKHVNRLEPTKVKISIPPGVTTSGDELILKVQ